jgi:putative ABC transport system permease protein
MEPNCSAYITQDQDYLIMSTRARNPQPPRWLDKLVERFCAPHLLEQVMGDLHERYYRRAEREGEARARKMYWREVLAYMRPSVFKRKTFYCPNSISIDVLRNYFISAVRNLYRKRFYTAINIFGLTLGLTAAAIVILYSRHELSYDRFHPESDHTYRISGNRKFNNTWFVGLPITYSNELYRKTLAEIESIVRIRLWPPKFIRYKSNKIFEEKILITDPGSDFFRLFDFRFLEGSSTEALRQPNSAVITLSVAQQLFGNEDPVGQTIVFDTLQFTVTGIIKDLPSNTHFDFKVLFTNAHAMEEATGTITYAKFYPNTDLQAFKKRLLSIPNPANEFDVLADAAIIPIEDLHFESSMTYEMKPSGSKRYFLSFVLTGILITILSWVNYMNLSVALYAERRKEIAIRKVVGAGNASLAVQFLLETICLSLACLPLALLLVEWLLPWFNQLMGIHMQHEFIRSPHDFGLLAGVTMLIGIASGFYPAWALPQLKAMMLFKKESMISKSGLSLRQALVTFQIAVLVFVISVSWIIHNQLTYMQKSDVGFQKEGVLKLKGAWWVDSVQYNTLKSELLRYPSIQQVSSGFAPGDEDYGFSFKEANSDIVYNDLITFVTDEDYLKTLGLELIHTDYNNLSDEKPGRRILINETLARRLGSDVLGKTLVLSPGNQERMYTINGVFKDFNFFSLRQPMAPMLLRLQPDGSAIYQNILIKIQAGHYAQTLGHIKKKADEIIPDIPLTTEFLDDALNRLYEKEQKLFALNKQLLLVAVLLSVLGLTGLAGYMSELRAKQIGVRKVLGASVAQVLALLSQDFIRLVLIAVLIATPVAWYAMHRWLQDFAYRIEIGVGVFLVAGMTATLIVLATVSWKSIKAALANPVDCLRNE